MRATTIFIALFEVERPFLVGFVGIFKVSLHKTMVEQLMF
jgi:hypothetical protein